MNHIDVGTIHAWLDGALDEAQSREIEAHVAECSVCSAAVAEERGMIAGASRILLALDDVPAGVTPKKAPARAPVAPRRQWRAAPWVTGIAAALILAIGVTTWNRDAVQKGMTARDEAARAPVVQLAPPPSPVGADTIARLRSPGGTAASTALPSREGTAANIASKTAAQALRETKTEPTRDRRVMTSKAAAPSPQELPMAAPPATTGALAGAAAQRRLATDSRLADVVATSAPEAATASRAEIVRVDELAGCYSVKPADVGKGAVSRVAAGAEAPAQRTAKAAAPSAAPSAARADFAASTASTAPAIVRLDTARKRAGYAVLAATADSLIGYWNVTGDSATADLLMRGTFAISQRNRVDCPGR